MGSPAGAAPRLRAARGETDLALVPAGTAVYHLMSYAPGLGTGDGKRAGRAVRPARQSGHLACACDTGPCARRGYYVDLSVAADRLTSVSGRDACRPYDGFVRIHHRTRRLSGVRGPASGGQTRAAAARRHAGRLEHLYRFLSARAACRVSVRARHRPLRPARAGGRPPAADARGGRGAADDDWRGCESVDRSSGELAVLAAAGARGRAVLRAVGDRAAGAAVAVVHDASARVRSVFPLRREQRRKPARAAHVSRGDRTPPRARRAEPLVGDRLRDARHADGRPRPRDVASSAPPPSSLASRAAAAADEPRLAEPRAPRSRSR